MFSIVAAFFVVFKGRRCWCDFGDPQIDPFSCRSRIGVLVISSYLPEILALSDRILVVKQGKIVEEMNRSDADEKKIMYAAVH